MGATNLTITFGTEAAGREFVRKASGSEAAMLIDGKRVHVITTDENISHIYEAAKRLGGLVVNRDTATPASGTVFPPEGTTLIRIDED